MAKEKKMLSTSLDKTVLDAFKEKCKEKDYKMNEILEVLMDSFVNDDIQIVKETSYKVCQKK